MNRYHWIKEELRASPKHWLVTGVAGFIGSNLLETLLENGQSVTGLDNFSTGKRENLEEVKRLVSLSQWSRFRFREGDIRNASDCREACQGVDFILHQAALGSVPRSLADPFASHDNNVSGILNMLLAARDAGVSRFVYASSSSVYGDHPGLPKREEETGECLSPYAVTKRVDELYAGVFARCYGLTCIGLRYFNVFGPRQDPDGTYAAVMPKWIAGMLNGDPIHINGDGETSRDFCYVANAVQANLLAATVTDPAAVNKPYNVAVHARTTLNELFEMIRSRLARTHPGVADLRPIYRDFREGDVRHSEADISRAREQLGYAPLYTVDQGLDAALEWYVRDAESKRHPTAGSCLAGDSGPLAG